MAIFNLENFNINEGETTDIVAAIRERFNQKPLINSIHRVITGLKYNELIPFIGIMPDSGVCQDDCETTESSSAIAWTNKRWSPSDVGAKFKICPKDYRAILNTVRDRLTKEGIWNPEGSEEMQIVEDRALDAMVGYIFRFTWFGDVDANTFGTGYGTLTPGTNITLFNCVDGLWKQAFAAVTAGTLERVEIAENEEATKAAQLALDPSTAFNTMKAMYNAADPRLFDQSGVQFLVTRSLALNYLDFLETNGMENGILPLQGQLYAPNSYRGIPIVVMNEWDRLIRKYYDNGTTYDLPHRAVLTSPDNIPVGFVEDDMMYLKSWFSNDDEAAYIKIRNEFDAKLLEEYAAVVAY